VHNASVLGRSPLFLILKGHHLGYYRNVLPPFELKLLVMWETIGEALRCKASTNFQKHGISANRSGSIWCMALHGILFACFNFTKWCERALALHKEFAALHNNVTITNYQ
jgi:predicted GNAT family acetyltransferase